MKKPLLIILAGAIGSLAIAGHWSWNNTDISLAGERQASKCIGKKVEKQWLRDSKNAAVSVYRPSIAFFPDREPEAELYSAFCDEVRKDLLTPSVATFAPLYSARDAQHAEMERIEDDSYSVETWVDTQNENGAMIRKKVSAILLKTPPMDGKPIPFDIWLASYQLDNPIDFK